MVDATIYLLYVALRMNYGRAYHCLNLYKAIVTLIFNATLQLSADIQLTSINDVVAKMQSYFSEWICDTNSGRDMFGGERCVTLRTAVTELNVRYNVVHVYGKIQITL